MFMDMPKASEEPSSCRQLPDLHGQHLSSPSLQVQASVRDRLQGAPQPLPVKKLPSGAVKRRMHKYTSHHLLTLRMQPTFSSMAHVCGKTQFYTSMQACLEAQAYSLNPTAQSPVQGEAIAVAEGAVASEAMAMAWNGGAHAIAAGHSIHVLLMLGQNLVCLRVACTDIGGTLRCKSALGWCRYDLCSHSASGNPQSRAFGLAMMSLGRLQGEKDTGSHLHPLHHH